MNGDIRVEKYQPEHLIELLKHPSQAITARYVGEKDAQALSTFEHCYTVFKGEKIVACIGLVKYWEGRYEAWAFLLPGFRDVFLFIHNGVKKFLKNGKFRRIEATAESRFPNGHKWVNLLGFKCECARLEKYGPTGSDYTLYTYIREDE